MQKSKQFLQFLKSLKFRLILLIVVIAIVPSLILSAAVLKYYEKRAVSIRESEILSQAKILANQIATSEYMKLGADVSSSNIQTQIDMLTTIYDGRVIVVDDNCKVYYDTYNLDDHKLIIAEEVMRSFKGEDIVHYDSENHYIEMTIPISDPDDKSETVIGVMLISVSTDNIVINQSYMRQVAVIVMVMVGIAIVFFAILLLLYFLKPLQKIEEGIAAIKNGYGEYNLQVNDYTETAGICEKINQMLGRIKVMDDSRQEFVSNVSHELKTQLTSMKVLADSINSMPDAPKELYQEFMEDITNEIERETKIINDLLSLVKMDKSAAGLNVSSVNINELLEQILKRLQPIADKQKVELVLESFRPVTAEVDEVKITLAITNLVENAIKYNRNDGEGWVDVSLNADHQYFYLKVVDSGIGIPEESLDHIYERFYRVDKSHSREIGGTGLGLAICQMIVEKMGGAITVESELHEGSTFRFTIPYDMYNKQEKFKKNAEREQHLKVAIKSLQLRTLLVAEDVDSNFLLMNTVLGKKYKLIRARDGREAVDMYKENHPDLIFMDIKMPYMDGLEATRLIRGYSKDIPIIALTAFAFESDREKAIEAGCNDYLTKPVSQEAIEKILDKYSL